jgi:hypothetical protein
MPLSPRRAACLAAIAVGFMTAAPAASASTRTHPMNAIPPDCTFRVNAATSAASLTCTARPAGQAWELGAACFLKAGTYTYRYGSEVTGNGTSTIPFCPGATDAGYYPLP